MAAAKNTRIGAQLRKERKERGWDVPQMAHELGDKLTGPRVDHASLVSYVWRWEAGKYTVSERYRLAYAAALDKDESELFGIEEDPVPPVAGSLPVTDARDEWDDDLERRLLLQLATLGLGVSALGGAEPVRQLLALTLNSEPRDLDDWHLSLADHLYALRTRPPAQVRDGLVIDLLAIQRQLQASPPRNDEIELQRIVAVLSILYANTLTRLGDHAGAIHWCRTAKAAADVTGDRELGLMVRGSEAGFGLYGQRDPATVLRLTQKAQNIAGDAPSVGLTLVNCAQIKALSLLGRHGEARQHMRALSAPGDSSEALIPTYWTGDQLHFTQSWVYAHAGDESAADEARDRLLSYSFLDYQYVANVRLHEAVCTVVNGGIDTGTRQAAEILDALPQDQRSHMITETGKTVLRAVPLDQRDRLAAKELRALTAGPLR